MIKVENKINNKSIEVSAKSFKEIKPMLDKNSIYSYVSPKK